MLAGWGWLCCADLSAGDCLVCCQVVHILKDLCMSNMTIICSIHQPRSSIFQTFDELLLLSAGRVAYFGPVPNTVHHMETIALPGTKLPAQTNVADWVSQCAGPCPCLLIELWALLACLLASMLPTCSSMVIQFAHKACCC